MVQKDKIKDLLSKLLSLSNEELNALLIEFKILKDERNNNVK